jgi:hypothetical protein
VLEDRLRSIDEEKEAERQKAEEEERLLASHGGWKECSLDEPLPPFSIDDPVRQRRVEVAVPASCQAALLVLRALLLRALLLRGLLLRGLLLRAWLLRALLLRALLLRGLLLRGQPGWAVPAVG